MINKFWSKKAIEEEANRILSAAEYRYGLKIVAPIPVEAILEHVADLKISWELIQEREGEIIWGGLRPQNHQVVLNERRLNIFEQKPGLELFTKGHELGHWYLHVDKGSLVNQKLPGLDSQKLQFICRDGDKSWEETTANRFAGCLLMPKQLLIPQIKKINRTSWPELYHIAEIFGVTISALTVRLSELKLLYIDDQRKIYHSAQEYKGQQSFL